MNLVLRIIAIGVSLTWCACPQKEPEKAPIKTEGKYVNAFGAKLSGLKARGALDVVVKTDPAVEAEKYIEPLTTQLSQAFSKCEQVWPEEQSVLQLEFPHPVPVKKGGPLELCLYKNFNSALVFEGQKKFTLMMRESK